MALQYETGTPSSVEDLVDKLQTFAGSNGWTVDEYDDVANRCSLHESNMYVHFAWDATNEDAIAIYQSLGYNGLDDIDDQPDDSGSGDYAPSTIDSGRRVDFNQSGPFTAYHFFAEDGASGDPMYIHVVVEVSSGIFRHFGFGTIEKVNDWTGGEYAYGHVWSQAAFATDAPSSTSHAFGLDSEKSSPSSEAATLHMEGVADQGGSEKWGAFFASSSTGNDTAGETRRQLYGGGRGGGYIRQLGHIRGSADSAYTPILPIPVMYHDTSQTPDKWIYLGQQPNVGFVNIANFEAGDEITLGGETWVVFPWVRKQYLKNDTQESWNAGVAYRKS